MVVGGKGGESGRLRFVSPVEGVPSGEHMYVVGQRLTVGGTGGNGGYAAWFPVSPSWNIAFYEGVVLTAPSPGAFLKEEAAV